MKNQVWTSKQGQSNFLWKEAFTTKIIGMGWGLSSEQLNEVSRITEKDEVTLFLQRLFPEEIPNRIGMIRRFIWEVQINDFVFYIPGHFAGVIAAAVLIVL